MIFVLRFAQIREAFRQAELESILECLGLDSINTVISEDTPYFVVELPDTGSALEILRRSVLLMDVYRLFAVGNSLGDIHNFVKLANWTEYVEKPFCFRIDSFKHTFDDSEQLDMINSFSFMPLKGPVKLSSPESVVFSILYDAPKKIWMFAERVKRDFQPMRDFVDKYSLKKREYLGTTSMDAELSLVMANVAKVQEYSLVYDPFVGTGSILVAAAHFGALTIGSDIDGRQMRGKLIDSARSSLHSNTVQYGLGGNILGGIVFDICQAPLIGKELFDAIICDPPYGVRAGAKRIAKTKERVVPVELHSVLYPTTAPYELDDLTIDLLAFACRFLVQGGRLVFWYAQDVKGDVFDPAPRFQHPGLKFKYSIPQTMRMICRWLLVYEKL